MILFHFIVFSSLLSYVFYYEVCVYIACEERLLGFSQIMQYFQFYVTAFISKSLEVLFFVFDNSPYFVISSLFQYILKLFTASSGFLTWKLSCDTSHVIYWDKWDFYGFKHYTNLYCRFLFLIRWLSKQNVIRNKKFGFLDWNTLVYVCVLPITLVKE